MKKFNLRRQQLGIINLSPIATIDYDIVKEGIQEIYSNTVKKNKDSEAGCY